MSSLKGSLIEAFLCLFMEKNNNSAVLVVYFSSFFIITAQQFAINVNWISLSNIYSTTFPVFLFEISTKKLYFSVWILDYNFMYSIHSHQLSYSMSIHALFMPTCRTIANDLLVFFFASFFSFSFCCFFYLMS